MPRLGDTYDVEIEVISKPIAEYNTDEYFELDLPVAPAVMVGEVIVIEGKDVPDEDIEKEICKQLKLPPPKPVKKGIIDRLLRK